MKLDGTGASGKRSMASLSAASTSISAAAWVGAVPQRIAYDNLRPAVRKILVGAERVLTTRFEALASHYLFEASFCRPRFETRPATAEMPSY